MITQDDLIKYKQFSSLVSKMKVEIQGEALIMGASLMSWFSDLEKKLVMAKDMYEMKEAKEKVSPIKEM